MHKTQSYGEKRSNDVQCANEWNQIGYRWISVIIYSHYTKMEIPWRVQDFLECQNPTAKKFIISLGVVVNRQGNLYPWRFHSASKEICNFSWVLLWTAKENTISLSVVANRQGKHHFLECCCKPPRNFFLKKSIFFMNLSNDLGWRNDLNQSCSTQKDIKLYRSNFFHLNSFRVSNMHYKIH